MQIRKIQESDLATCAKILEDAYGRVPYDEIFVKPNAKKYIKGKYDSCYTNSFVAIDKDNNVVGFIFLNISAWSEGLQAVLEEIVVSPDFQGQGIGKELIQYAHDYLNSLGAKSIMLWAKKDDRLLDFYKKQGYFPADDFVVMFKNF
jgi:predicted N-acetyltransferase YhbS